MESIRAINEWLSEYPTATSILKYLLWVLCIVFIIRFIRSFLRKNLPDTTTRYKSQKGVEIIGYILLIILSFSFFTGNIKDFTIIIGLFTAGIAFTLQELILSIAGSIYIFLVQVYKPGDRIEINGIKGDVIDVDSIYTTMMEIGKWVSTDNYSGRIVKLSNAFVFKGPVYNYSKDFPFIWDEFDLPVHYDSDIELAKSIMLKVASEILSKYAIESRSKWNDVVKRYYIEDAKVEPSLSITITDNWVQLNLRYIVDYKKRRYVKDLLHQRIYEEVLKTDDKVRFASTTVELVGQQKVKVEMKTPKI
ncbi:mechanosensitive ion channel family protein [Aquimarina sp. SS2-1]|uniref:mechanosensitive ion channel family protein n=1 Tax=Aquimarina besae TaxID=3342247 RepID=UPI00366CC3C7